MRQRIMGAALCVALATGVSACRQKGPQQQGEVSDAVTSEQVALCAEKMKITFPPSTEPLRFVHESGVHTTLWLKARISTNDIQTLINQSPFTGQALRGDRVEVICPPDLDWWRPDEARNYMSGIAILPDDSSLRILIDRGDPAKAVVYLQWHAM